MMGTLRSIPDQSKAKHGFPPDPGYLAIFALDERVFCGPGPDSLLPKSPEEGIL
jgi:hypothetical protein